jgi:ornithine carbamoyltransferase
VDTDVDVDGQGEEAAARRAALAGFTVDDEMLRCAHADAWFLHWLPAHRGEEVAASVIDGPRSAVWQQAANRMHGARAVLTHLIDPG